MTVGALCGKYLTQRESRVESGELSPRSFLDCATTARRIQKTFGKNRSVSDIGPGDFDKLRKAINKIWGPVRVGNEIVRVRGVFLFPEKNDLVTIKTKFGDGFQRPKRAVMRRDRHTRGVKMFAPDELKRMLAVASPCLKAMLLLGLNGGFPLPLTP